MFVNRLIPLHIPMAQAGSDSDSDDDFKYTEGLRNNQALEDMYRERREENASMETNIKKRLAEITKEDIEDEVRKFWQFSKLNRQRITKRDIELATDQKKKNDESNRKHLAFLERHRDKL